MIKYIKGDLFEIIKSVKTPIIIPHVCNNVNAWGSGFVVPLAKHFPKSKVDFHNFTKRYNSYDLLAETCFTEDYIKQGIVIANMFAQNGLITDAGNDRPLNYYSLVKCMESVQRYIHYDISYDMTHDIYCPKFGSGLSGGQWDIIEEFINDIWVKNNINVNVCVL